MLYLCNCLCLQQQSTKKMKVCTDRVRTTRRNIFSECMTEIQGKSILVRVSARFELARVRVIGSRLYVSHISLFLAVKMKGKFPSWRPFYPKFSQQRNIKCLTEERRKNYQKKQFVVFIVLFISLFYARNPFHSSTFHGITMLIICGPRSFPVHFGDHLQSEDHLRLGSFTILYRSHVTNG